MIVFLGAPGCGKGTQASLLSKNLGYVQISTGNLLRAESQDKIKTMNMGSLVNDDFVCSLVSQEMMRHPKDKILLDGFPRTLPQAKHLDDFWENTLLSKKSQMKVFLFSIDADSLLQRILGRVVCQTCGEVYHATKDPVLEVCRVCKGTNFSARGDDSPLVFQNRLRLYEENVKSMIGYYEERLFEIDASKNVDVVYRCVISCLD